MPLPEQYWQFAPGIEKWCAPIASVAALPERLCRLTDAACPLRVLSALYGSIQRQEGAGAPPHYPDVSLRGAERRGNLGKALTFSPELPCYPALYCEIATSAFGLLAMTNL